MVKVSIGVRSDDVLRVVVVVMSAVLLVVSSFHFRPVSAAANDVIINEIMYNPSTAGGQNDEFLELYNTTGANIDLEGWCFTEGITLCFTAGVEIPAGGYIVVSPSMEITQARYNLTTEVVAAYTGNLSNGGETLTLQDDTATTVTSLTYDDASPWPTSPDGNGPSLELKDTSFDTTQGSSWGASVGAPTPGVVNSLVGLALPVISNVSQPENVPANTGVAIFAVIDDADAAELVYKINFDAEVTASLVDDGTNGDTTAGDGLYTGEIPGQPVSTLVRYKVVATNGGGESTIPSVDDSTNYRGYEVNDTSVTSNAPILNWYIDEADYEDMHTNHVNDDVYVPAVIVYDDKVFDNSQVRIKGDYSRTFPKKSYKFKLPSGYKVGIAGGSNREVGEFHVNSGYTTGTISRMPMAYWVVEQTGAPVPDILPMRIQRNGEFEGLYVFAEKYEYEWRQEYGYNDGQFLEEYNEVVSGSSNMANRDAWYNNMILDRADPTKRDHVLDDNDIPNLLNYNAIVAILQSHDTSLTKNTFLYRNNTNERWSALLWDLDLLFQGSPYTVTTPYSRAPYIPTNEQFALTAIYNQPDLRTMYYRRLRTLIDMFYSSNQLATKYSEINATYAADMALDLAKWPAQGEFSRTSEAGDLSVMARQRLELLVRNVVPWGIPPAQLESDEETVSIEEAVESPTNADEYIKVSTTAGTPVDISGWKIEGIGYTIPPGAVIPANGSIYFLRDDPGYRASHPSVIVGGNFSNDLSSGPGTLVLRKADNTEIDNYAY